MSLSPIDRVRRNREMAQMARKQARPTVQVAQFPRNTVRLMVILFVVLPLVYKAMADPTPENIIGYGMFTLGFGLGLYSLSLGQKAKGIYDGQYVGRAARIPFKLIGAGLIGIAAAALTWFQGGVVAQALAVLPVMAALSVLAFGIDPMKTRGLDTDDEREAHFLEQLLARTGTQMLRIRRSANPLAVPEVMVEIQGFDAAVNRLLDVVAGAPERVRTVRKFFTVYLDGAAEAAESFAKVYRVTGDEAAKMRFVTLLRDLTQAYQSEAHAYALAHADRLEVELSVLDHYLAGERRAVRV